MIVFIDKNVHIEYFPEKKLIIQTWSDFVPSELFRQAIDATVKFVKVNKVESIISDTLKQRAIKPEDSEYAASVMPVLFENGLKAMAFIIPENIFTKLALKNFADKDKSNKIQYFMNINEAFKWIEWLLR